MLKLVLDSNSLATIRFLGSIGLVKNPDTGDLEHTVALGGNAAAKSRTCAPLNHRQVLRRRRAGRRAVVPRAERPGCAIGAGDLIPLQVAIGRKMVARWTIGARRAHIRQMLWRRRQLQAHR